MTELIRFISGICFTNSEELTVVNEAEKEILEQQIFHSKLIKTVGKDISVQSCFEDLVAIDKLKLNIKPLDLDNRIFSMLDTSWILKGTKESEIQGKDLVVRRSVCLPEEYSVDGLPNRAEAPRYGNLLRPVITQHMKKVIEDENLKYLDVVEERYVANPYNQPLNKTAENLAVISRKADVLTGIETGLAFIAFPADTQQAMVSQFCTFIEKTGLVDAHFGNLQFAILPKMEEELQAFREKVQNHQEITMHDLTFLGKLTIVDTELHGNDHLSSKECGQMGLLRFKQAIIEAYQGNPPQVLLDIVQERIESPETDIQFENFMKKTFYVVQDFFSNADEKSDIHISFSNRVAEKTNKKKTGLKSKVKSLFS